MPRKNQRAGNSRTSRGRSRQPDIIPDKGPDGGPPFPDPYAPAHLAQLDREAEEYRRRAS